MIEKIMIKLAGLLKRCKSITVRQELRWPRVETEINHMEKLIRLSSIMHLLH